jgi:hypothetical protein
MKVEMCRNEITMKKNRLSSTLNVRRDLKGNIVIIYRFDYLQHLIKSKTDHRSADKTVGWTTQDQISRFFQHACTREIQVFTQDEKVHIQKIDW